MIDGKKLFFQPVKNDNRAYEHIRNIVTGQGDDCTTAFVLDDNLQNMLKDDSIRFKQTARTRC